ncbi:uncharacterized protein K460DRAFT_400971 [Cucurbitaria berberidis CBS 394.84]|uniref:Uncharacterized protein n=1 Tax=Cucurbitaria berberidis CBS 394.84 TaxID=1168544 RepID=A0A9P4GSD8_9PLEO|nr:uncharacterized protein K460DRAFT_400971 [Cucurbitaria berberidis CBS 394.84]KAF1850937.1 hypothetical protein K460DRAFT_400971 [Cucurbitaria berberidis CBS 394.84]
MSTENQTDPQIAEDPRNEKKVAILVEGGPRLHSGWDPVWICMKHKILVPTTIQYCKNGTADPCYRYQPGHIYGFRENDPQWGCLACFTQADGTPEHPLISINPAYQAYCKNWVNCKGLHRPYTGRGAWSVWECAYDATMHIPRRFGQGNINEKGVLGLDGQLWHHCSNFDNPPDGDLCPVTLEAGSRDEIWVRPNFEKKPGFKDETFEWRCACAVVHEHNVHQCGVCGKSLEDTEYTTTIVRNKIPIPITT